MKYSFALLVIATSSTVAADPTVYSAVKGEYTVEMTSPNGKVDKRKLGDGSESASKESFLVPPGVDKVSLKILDGAGKEVWKGTSGPNDAHVLLPDGKDKVKAVFAGHASGVGETPKAALFISLEDGLTLDLVGSNGVGAHRGIKPGKAFDPKQQLKLDPKEATFQVEVKAKGAKDPVKTAMKVEPGRYYLVSAHPREGYRLLALGYIPAPPAPAKPAKKK